MLRITRIGALIRGLRQPEIGKVSRPFKIGFSSQVNKSLDKEKYDSGEISPFDPNDPVTDDTTKLDKFLKSGDKDIDPSEISLWDLEKKGALPGFRKDFTPPTKYEIAFGWERYEVLCELMGKDPWTDFRAIPLMRRPTAETPLKIRSVDPVFYIGCSGYPVDSHELLWLTLSPHGQIDRCPQCGNCFKYTQIPVPNHDHHHDSH